jgi:RNA polymerase sigma factor (sigma-70 family)
MHYQATPGHDASIPAPASLPADFQRDLIALIPHLRAFSRGLCRNSTTAEDMVQEALARAWRARASFEPGTNLKSWIFTILHNTYFSHHRRAARQADWDPVAAENIQSPPRAQEFAMELRDTARALQRLTSIQREAVILVGAGGFSYEAAAKICGAPAGTVKSRVARARTALAEILDGDRRMAPRARPVADNGLDDILAQLSALTRPGAHGADLNL